MTKDEVLARIDGILNKGQAAIDSVDPMPPPDTRYTLDPETRWVKPDVAVAFRVPGLSLLSSLYGTDHQFYKDFDNYTDKHTLTYWRQAHALIRAVREEVDNDWLNKATALISAEVFANIIEMAEYLLAENYKDAAAVLIGGALEGHLRTLSNFRGIATHVHDVSSGRMKARKAESLNQDLQKANTYALGDQKQITAWLDLRNEAAHGHYANYNADQVNLMLQGVRNFIVRVPA
jgi:hypothetical protein